MVFCSTKSLAGKIFTETRDNPPLQTPGATGLYFTLHVSWLIWTFDLWAKIVSICLSIDPHPYSMLQFLGHFLYLLSFLLCYAELYYISVSSICCPLAIRHVSHDSCFLCFTAADFLGEKLAWFFGITTPKYQYIIDEYHRLKKEVRPLLIHPYTRARYNDMRTYM